MFFYEGLSCPVCKAAFRQDEDIVACPQCGLPHHRACWEKIGHCYHADKHNTDEQWSREKAQAVEQAEPVRRTTQEPYAGKICDHCHTKNAQYAEYCTHCGHPLEVTDWHSAPRSSVGEYTPFRSAYNQDDQFSSAENLGGASAQDLAAVVGSNTRYYMPRFRRIAHKVSGGWNWAAFLLGPYWLLYRKQYVFGILLVLIQTVYDVLSNILLEPFLLATTQEEQTAAMASIMENRFLLPILFFSAILFVVHILLGVWGNALYKRHCEKRIRAARENTPDLTASELTSVGGTSAVAVMVCYFVIYMLSYVSTLLLSM